MGPIAARMLLELIECAADIVGIEVLLAAQALDLRMRGIAFDAEGKQSAVEPVKVAPAIATLHARVREVIPYWEDDDVLHPCLAAAGQMVRRGTVLGNSQTW